MRLKVKYNCSLSIFIFLFIQTAFAQTITVLEEGSLVPIPGVAIYNLKKTKSLVTDFSGKVSLSDFKANETIYFQSFLYQKLQLKKSSIAENNPIVFLQIKVEGLKQIVISNIVL